MYQRLLTRCLGCVFGIFLILFWNCVCMSPIAFILFILPTSSPSGISGRSTLWPQYISFGLPDPPGDALWECPGLYIPLFADRDGNMRCYVAPLLSPLPCCDYDGVFNYLTVCGVWSLSRLLFHHGLALPQLCLYPFALGLQWTLSDWCARPAPVGPFHYWTLLYTLQWWHTRPLFYSPSISQPVCISPSGKPCCANSIHDILSAIGPGSYPFILPVFIVILTPVHRWPYSHSTLSLVHF